MFTAALSVVVMRLYAHCLVWTALLLGCVVSLLIAILFFSVGSVAGGIIFLIVFLLNCWYVNISKGRVPFAVAVLETVVDVSRLHPGTFVASMVSIIFQAGWNIAWLYAAIGALNEVSNSSSGIATKIAYFFLALSYYWTSQTVANIVLTTCAGVLAEWYFKAPNQESNATFRSFKRAATTSLGSIIFGSFLVAVIKALRSTNSKDNKGIGACIVDCILSCFQAIIEAINFWAFTYVSVYGMPYCDAAKATFELFANRGFGMSHQI